MLTKAKVIDISKWNGDIDFRKVKEDGIDYAVLRSSFRHTVDSKFHEYVQACKENGIYVIGVYHFSYALTVAQATSEARFCLEQVEKAGLPKSTIVFFDFEYDTVTKAKNSGVELTRSDCIAHAAAFCEYVKKQEYYAGIYTNLDYYKNWYTPDLIKKYVFWLADYSGDPDYSCTLHQYTNKGRVNGISGDVDLNWWYTEAPSLGIDLGMDRNKVIALAKSWMGKNEWDGSYKEIIDVYNSYEGPFPRGTKMDYSWAWCACFWSALMVKLGYAKNVPIEISCGYLIEEAKKFGCWVEDDSYVPTPGDAILYDWEDTGIGDNLGWPDHVGVVTYVNPETGYMLVIEGNKSNRVCMRAITLNGRYIRGFVTPEYSSEHLDPYDRDFTKSDEDVAIEILAGGIWGDTEDEIQHNVEVSGYSYANIYEYLRELIADDSAWVGDYNPNQPTAASVVALGVAQSFNKNLAGAYTVTANSLNVRTGASTNQPILISIPNGTEVRCYGYYTLNGATKWLYVQVAFEGTLYTGFVSGEYLKKK